MNEQFCPNCGRRPVRANCCWHYGAAGHAEPCPLVAVRAWEAWNEEQQFLVSVLLERFGGAAAEWELLCRLPWPQYRLEEHVCDFEDRPEDAGERFVCFREKDDKDRGRRYFVTDMARHAYERHRQGLQAAAGFGSGYPFGRAAEEALAVKEQTT